MDLDAFKASLGADSPPTELGPPLRALWHQAKGGWQDAHRIAQDVDDMAGSWVHAHLHRAEGDRANAEYWYRKAGKPFPTISLEEEWDAIAAALLSEAGPSV